MCAGAQARVCVRDRGQGQVFFLLLSILFFEAGSLTEPGAPASSVDCLVSKLRKSHLAPPTSSGVIDVDAMSWAVMWILGIRTQVLMLVLPAFYLLNYVFYNSEQCPASGFFSLPDA